MSTEKALEEHLKINRLLEVSYLQTDDPIRQSGFGGGAVRWRQEREPILGAVGTDGSFLDVGCANGYLMECLTAWAGERGFRLEPYGLDLGVGLIEVARTRQPSLADHFFVGNAWDWEPPRRFRYVYSLYDNVPLELLGPYINRLLSRMVEPGGRLILGAYGSRSKGLAPFDVAAFLGSVGLEVMGRSEGGDPVIARFAWVQAPLHTNAQ